MFEISLVDATMELPSNMMGPAGPQSIVPIISGVARGPPHSQMFVLVSRADGLPTMGRCGVATVNR